MSTTRRRSRRHMSKETLKQEEADALKAIKEKEKQQQKRLKSIDALIKRLSPRTSRKIKSGFKKLHTAHKTKQQIRKLKKQEQQRKAKATRAVNKRIKTEKLDKENAKVLKLLIREGNLPLDVAIIIAKDRLSLQKEDKRKKKERERLENEITGLKSTLPGTESAIKSVEKDIDGMREKNAQSVFKRVKWGVQGVHKPFQHITLRESIGKLTRLQRRQQEIISNISKIEETLKTLA